VAEATPFSRLRLRISEIGAGGSFVPAGRDATSGLMNLRDVNQMA